MGSREPDDLAFIHQVGNALCRRGWRTPALLFLEAGRPLALFGGQLLWVLAPALSIFTPGRYIDQLARFLEQPRAIEALVEFLENDRHDQRGVP